MDMFLYFFKLEMALFEPNDGNAYSYFIITSPLYLRHLLRQNEHFQQLEPYVQKPVYASVMNLLSALGFLRSFYCEHANAKSCHHLTPMN